MDPHALSALIASIAPHQQWQGSLMFDLSKEGDGSAVSNLMLAVPPSKGEVRFPVSRYPPTWEDRQVLIKDIQRAAIASQQELIQIVQRSCNNSSERNPSFTLACSRHRKYEQHSKNRRKSSDKCRPDASNNEDETSASISTTAPFTDVTNSNVYKE